MKKTQSIISICLCLILLFSVVSSPIRANADSFVGVMQIATNYQDVINVAPYLLPIIIIIVALDWTNTNADAIAAKAEEIYNNGTSALRAWGQDCAQQIIDGTSAFKINSSIRDEINRYSTNGNKMDDKDKYVLLPPDLLALGTVNRSDVLTEDATELLKANNDLIQKSNRLLTELKANILLLPNLIANSLSSSFSNLVSELESLRSDLNNEIGYIKNVAGTIEEWTGNVNDTVAEFGRDTEIWLGNVNQSVGVYGKQTVDWLKNVNSNLVHYSTKIDTSIKGVATKIDTLIETIPAQVEDSLAVPKPEIAVQVGAQTLVVTDYPSMGKAFSAKMAWVPQIFDFLSELRSRLNSGTPPKVSINLAAAEGNIKWGDSAYVLDMTWYARYKPTVDTVLSGIMWLCFGWAIYKRIPDILSGVGLTMENATQTPGHVWSDRAEHSASLKYRSDRRQDYYSKRGR